MNLNKAFQECTCLCQVECMRMCVANQFRNEDLSAPVHQPQASQVTPHAYTFSAINGDSGQESEEDSGINKPNSGFAL